MVHKINKSNKSRSSSVKSNEPHETDLEPPDSPKSDTYEKKKILSFQELSFISNEKTEKSGFFQKNNKTTNKPLINMKKSAKILEENIERHQFRNLIFSPEVSCEKFKGHLSLIQRGLIYSKACLKQPSVNYLKNKYINLGEKKSKIEYIL